VLKEHPEWLEINRHVWQKMVSRLRKMIGSKSFALYRR
jgi:hypothetical protein